MRNLRCLHQSQVAIQSALPCAVSTWDSAHQAILYTLGPSNESPKIELWRASKASTSADGPHGTQLIASWDAPSPHPDLPLDKVLSLQYLTAMECTCLVLEGGDIVFVQDNSLPGQESVEIVGSVDSGIATAQWSVDQDLLAIVTKASTLLIMTAEMENVAQVSLKPEDASLSKQVNVGWGKSETQFKGKGAKAMRDPTIPERVDSGTLSPSDDMGSTICWRGDGAYVAINTVEQDERRMVRIFSREGVLESVTEAVNGLEGAICWKPSGQLIGGLQRTDDDLNVVFFERNGLRHGEFSLRMAKKSTDQSTHHVSLGWNIDSTILAVAFRGRVQFWTMGNYHYYLKYDLVLDGDANLTTVDWHPEDALICLVHTQEKTQDAAETKTSLRTVRFALCSSDGSNIPPHDYGCVAVVDGTSIKVTPIRIANVPPPMALFDLECAHNGIDVLLSPTNESMGVLHSDCVSLFKAKQKHGAGQDWILESTLDIPRHADVFPLQLHLSTIYGWMILLMDLQSNRISLLALQTSTVIFECLCTREALVCVIADSPNLAIVVDGVAREISEVDDSKRPNKICTFPGSVSKMAALKTNDTTVVFALTGAGSLFANEKLLMRNCTSFLLTDKYLIVTSATHLMKFIHIAVEQLDSLVIPDDNPTSDELCRSIERGARLITAMPSTSAVVLQMPRGNLETVYPRALVLSAVRASINAKNYRKAFMACRKHRVDMNLLYDHNPDQFLDSVELIVRQLREPEHIDLFLSQLSDENVTQTLYREPNPVVEEQRLTAQNTPGAKINSICDAFIAAFHGDHSASLRNMITANLCKDPPDIESGLEKILELQKQSSDLLDEAIEHICFLADVNRIFDTALGMYELDLALLIAQQSQKDPREYLPYLQQLQVLDSTRRKFQIDDDLGRRSKAIEHLYKAGTIDEVEQYALKNELHTRALDICKYNKNHHDQIMRSYAGYLESRNRYREAAIAFESLNQFRLASAAYTSAAMWREALSCAQCAGPETSASELRQLAASLAEAQEAAKDYTAAAQIHLDYLQDVRASVRLFCRSHHFSEALRIAAKAGRAEIAAELVDPGLAEGFSTLIELLSECKGQLNAQMPRLQELRKKRDTDPLAFLEGGAAAGDRAEVPDDISLAGSVTSTHASTLLTRYTARSGNTTLQTGASRKTSRNAKREERKRARGKKGSVYEEEYLVNSIGRLIERINSTNLDVERTVEGLCRRGMWERASTLDRAMRDVHTMCETCISEVWETAQDGSSSLPAATEDDADEAVTRSGGDRVLWESMHMAKQSRTPPTVKPYEDSGLLPR